MKKHYELLFIVKPTLTEEEIAVVKNDMSDLITKNEGEIASINDMGMRTLAYEINKSKRGYYFVFYFKAPGLAIKEIERVIGIREDIVKHLTLKFENKTETATWDKLVLESNKRQKVENQ